MNFQKMDQFIDKIEELYGVPNCDCSVYCRHKEVFRHRAGHADSAGKRPVSENDLYWLYSASKVTLATAVMQLIEKGLLSLEDPVRRYLPYFGGLQVKTPDGMRACQRDATIEDLLSMRAGLDYNLSRKDMLAFTMQNPDADLQEIIRQYLTEPLSFEPGTRFLYSMCLDVAGAIVEIVTGQRYGDYVRDHIAGPLGMKYCAFRVLPGTKAQMVQQYQYNIHAQDSIDIPAIEPIDSLSNIALFGSRGFECPGGGIISRVSDYVLLADALANEGIGATGEKILEQKSIDNMRTNRMTTPVLYSDHAKMQNYGYGYGLGVRTLVDPYASKGPVGAFGWDGLGGAFLLADPENHISLFFLMSVVGMPHVKAAIHNKLRDYTYEAIL